MSIIQSRGIIAKLVRQRRGIDSQPSGALKCVFLNTEQFHAGGEQPAHYRGRPKGCSEESPTGWKEF